MEKSYAGAKVLVTGGAGFIGSHLARALVNRGADVTVIDSLIPEYGGNLFNLSDLEGRIRINISDVRDEHSMKHLVQGVDVLFNLAGQTSHLDSMQNPFPDLEINCKAQLSILEACRKFNPGIKVVYASTRQLYGAPEYLPVDEAHPTRPVDINGINKLAGEWYHLVFNNAYGVKTVVLRLTNTYGPGMRIKDARQTFLGIWIRLAIEGKRFMVFGDGLQVRDYNFVADVVDAMIRCGQADVANGKIYNLGAPEHLSLHETARILESKTSAGFDVVPFPQDRKAIDIGDYYADYSLIQGELGWAPVTPFAEGLEETVAYFRKNMSHYVDPKEP